MNRSGVFILATLLTFPTLVFAQDSKHSANQSPEFIDSCRETFDTLEIKFKLIHEHIVSELLVLPPKLASSEFEKLKAADSKVREMVAAGKREDFKAYRSEVGQMADKYIKSPAFQAQKERLKKDGLDLFITFYDGRNWAGTAATPRLSLRIQDSTNSIGAEDAIATPGKITTEYWYDPSAQAYEQTLRKIDSDCRYFIGKNRAIDAKAVSTKTSVKPSSNAVERENSAGPQDSAAASTAK